jgi:ligand-binding sensor domain-containing protein
LVRWPADEDVGDLLVTRRGLWAAGKRGVWTLGRPHRHAENLVVAGRAGVVALAQGGGHIWAVGARVTRMDRRGRLASTPLRFRPTDAAWSEGSLWISSATGLHRMDPVSMRMDPVLPLAGVTRVLAGHSGIWAVADGIPVRLEGRTPRVFMRARRVRDIAPMVDAVCLGTESGVERLLADGSVVVPAGDSLTGVVVPAVAHDGSGGCWYATDAGKVGRIGADDSHKSLSLEGGEVGWPDRIVPDGDWAWVVTRKGTHRVWLPPSAKP